MFEQFLAIARNTFFESIRQPIMLVILIIATLLLILSNPLATFTMSDDQRMFVDIGMATVFLFGALLASFIATSVLTREIENKTALTIISKPVGRTTFILGKYCGVSGAMLIGALYMTFVFLLVEQHKVLQTVRMPYHLPVITFGAGAAVLGVGVGVWCNYFYRKVFASTTICTTTFLVGLAYFFSLLFDAHFTPQSPVVAFRGNIWLGVIGLMMAILVLTSVALALSTRFSQVITLCATLGVFLVGLLSDWFLGRVIKGYGATWLERATQEGLTTTHTVPRMIELTSGETTIAVEQTIVEATVPLTQFASGWSELVPYWLAQIGYAFVPNFQVMLLSDALTQGHVIPPVYLAETALYSGCLIIIFLALAVILFQRREVG